MGNIMHRSNVPCVDAAYVLHVNWRYLFLNATFRLNLSTFFKHFWLFSSFSGLFLYILHVFASLKVNYFCIVFIYLVYLPILASSTCLIWYLKVDHVRLLGSFDSSLLKIYIMYMIMISYVKIMYNES